MRHFHWIKKLSLLIPLIICNWRYLFGKIMGWIFLIFKVKNFTISSEIAICVVRLICSSFLFAYENKFDLNWFNCYILSCIATVLECFRLSTCIDQTESEDRKRHDTQSAVSFHAFMKKVHIPMDNIAIWKCFTTRLTGNIAMEFFIVKIVNVTKIIKTKSRRKDFYI